MPKAKAKNKTRKPPGGPPSNPDEEGNNDEDGNSSDGGEVAATPALPKGNDLKNLKVTFNPLPQNTVGYEHWWTSTFNKITSAWYIDRKGAAEWADKVNRFPTGDPIAAETLLDNGITS